MKKVININFQGRVIPIEEPAYEMLQNYISSLRNYFANEEGRDEIINDIENRIAELLDEKLKKGSSCIVDTDVVQIMNSMGRPEDFEKEEEGNNTGKSAEFQQSASYSGSREQEDESPKKRLYRDEEDKILGGVASGLAHYLNVDPAVVRILFAVLAIFGGSGFLVYIILWIVLPSRSLVTNIRKRLYRDTEDRVISGVCGGLAKYFDINPAIPRIIFAAPFIFGIITSIGRSFFDNNSVFFGGFGGGAFILVYIILWIVLPEAFTASEKLEMKGEKVDMNSIRNTVMGDLQGVKGRAEKMGNELKGTAQKFAKEAGQTFGTGARNVASDTSAAVRKNSGGLANALAILIKAFVFFIVGCILLGLFVGLIVLLGSGLGHMPLRDFILQGPLQNGFAWGTVLLFIGAPVMALIVWFIRRLMQVKTHNKYIGYTFSALWFVGLFCLIGLIASVSRNFSSQVGKRVDINLVQPTGDRLIVTVGKSNMTYYNSWVDIDGIMSADRDSIYLNTARINIIQSSDSSYHLHLVKISKGHDRQQAQNLAERIDFRIDQRDSLIQLPENFTVSRNQKWRNQRVLVVIEVPVGKKIRMDRRIKDYDYFNIDFGHNRNWRIDWEDGWDHGERWTENKDMTMTIDGLKWNKSKEKHEYYQYEEEDLPEAPEAPENTAPSAPAPVKSPGDSLKKASTYHYSNGTEHFEYDTEENALKAEAINNMSKSEQKLSVPVSVVMGTPLGTILRVR